MGLSKTSIQGETFTSETIGAVKDLEAVIREGGGAENISLKLNQILSGLVITNNSDHNHHINLELDDGRRVDLSIRYVEGGMVEVTYFEGDEYSSAIQITFLPKGKPVGFRDGFDIECKLPYVNYDIELHASAMFKIMDGMRAVRNRLRNALN